MPNSPLLVALARGLMSGIVPAALIEAAVSLGGGSVNVVIVGIALVLGALVAVAQPAAGLTHDRTVARVAGLVGYLAVVVPLQLLPSGVAFVVALTILAAVFVLARLVAERKAGNSGKTGAGGR